MTTEDYDTLRGDIPDAMKDLWTAINEAEVELSNHWTHPTIQRDDTVNGAMVAAREHLALAADGLRHAINEYKAGR